MNKLAMAGAVLASMMTLPAAAADMPVKAPALPAPAPALNWTGFYFGADAGGRWSDPSWTTTCLQPGVAGGAGCPTNNVVTGATLLANNNPASFNTASFRGGFYGGYNAVIITSCRRTW